LLIFARCGWSLGHEKVGGGGVPAKVTSESLNDDTYRDFAKSFQTMRLSRYYTNSMAASLLII
jgi:hypothetical protein